MNAVRAAQRVLVVGVLVVGSGGCQILGCEPRRCDINRPVACDGETEECGGDGFCRPKDFGPCTALERDEVRRSVTMNIDDQVGVPRMRDTLFGDDAIAAAFVSDLRGCTDEGGRPACPDPAGAGVDENPPVVEPLGALTASGAKAFAPHLVRRSLTDDGHAPVDTSEGFAVEILLRTPSRDAAVAVAAAMNDPETNDGWSMVFSEGFPAFVAGGRALGLGPRSDATWMHVLCAVDVDEGSPGLVGADDEDVLCVVDGRLGFLPATLPADDDVPSLGSGEAPVVYGSFSPGGAPLGDAAVAVVRVWSGDVFARAGLPDDALARSDALLEEARRRLARYVGLNITGGDGNLRFQLSNLDLFSPRAQPVDHGSARRHEVVGGGWPRVTHTAQGDVGLLLEPSRVDQLGGAWAGCAEQTRELLGRPDACPLTTTLFANVGTDLATGAPFAPGEPLVFSAFTDGDVILEVEGDVCASTNIADDEPCTVDFYEAPARRFVYRFNAPDDGSPMVMSLRAGAGTPLLWSPQLERGVDPTTPFNMRIQTDGVLQPAGALIGDIVIVTDTALAGGTRTSLRASVASDGSNVDVSPVFVADGGARFVRQVALLVTSRGDDVSGERRELVSLQVQEDQESRFVSADADFAFTSGERIRVGGDVGDPLDVCADCRVPAPRANLGGAAQWNTVGFTGIGEPAIVLDASVTTEGLAPLPIELDLRVGPPDVGCIDGQPAAVSLVACAAGACGDDTSHVWQGDIEGDVEAGPSLGELAVAGALTLSVPTTTVEALFVEVRFRTGARGLIFGLDRPDGTPLLEIIDDGGDAVLERGGDRVVVPNAFDGDDTWSQLSCFVGRRARCTVNAAPPVVLDGELGVEGQELGGARTGTGAGAIAFARAWTLPADLGIVDEERLADARTAASFGFLAAARRGPFTLVEVRLEPTTIERDGASLTIGPHWPRIVDDGGPLYVAEPGEGLSISGSDVASLLGLGFTLEGGFEGVGDGRFIVLVDDQFDEAGAPLTPVDALTIRHESGLLRFTVATTSLAEQPAPVPFDGAALLLGVRLFNAVVESDGAHFAFLPDIVGGGQTLLIGGEAPLGLRSLSVVTE